MAAGTVSQAILVIWLSGSHDAARPGRGLLGGLILLGCIAVVYPVVADRVTHPLTVFVLPILIVAALGTAGEAALLGCLSILVALIEGQATSDLGSAPLAARMVIIVATAVTGVVVARIRDDRERSLRDADRTGS